MSAPSANPDTPTATRRATRRPWTSKVPEIIAVFWVIKIMCTTIGETGADNLMEHTSLTLVSTLWLSTAVLVVVLAVQFAQRRYVPGVYWTVVVVISVVGTLITDYFTDVRGVSLWISTGVFSVALLIVFGIWYSREKTLSIKTIVTPTREAFYWLAVLVTFALGTAAGDLLAEQANLGYLVSGALFGSAIALTYLAWRFLGFSEVAAFWIAYVLTRPMGASIGDYLSQPKSNGGLGLGTNTTSLIFLGLIIGLVAYLSITRRDQLDPVPEPARP